MTHGQAAGCGNPAIGTNASETIAAPTEMSTVVASGSSPRLIAAFQPAWQAAANSTAAKTKGSINLRCAALRDGLRQGVDHNRAPPAAAPGRPRRTAPWR